jgi:hypothetical protein
MIKRRYYDLRLGGTMISPMVQMANFTMIIFLYVRHQIPIEIFAPLIMIVGFISLSYVGVRYRKHQASTDYNMLFEKQTQQNLVLLNIMLALKHTDHINSKEFNIQLEYLKSIT